MRQRQRSSRTTPGLTTAAAAAAAHAALDDALGQHIVHPAAVRDNIPLKKKVREKEAAKRARPAHRTGRSALAVFRRPARSKRHEHERRRRPGAVNTKDKVRSWLERENPTHEAVDSDNESRFPDEQPDARRRSAPDETPNENSAKMTRSTSEAEPDSRRLSRKTESHSHLLSTSALELDKAKDEADKVQRVPAASGKIHKSATDGHLQQATPAKSRFQSFELLSLLNGRKASRPDEAAKTRKRIGIGPVKVVLKWHGASRAKPKRVAGKDDKASRHKAAKKKRVIVYKNGDPTAGGGYVQPKEQQAPEAEEKPVANITSNPLDAAPGVALRSRRYSMQERQAPPALVRHVSEVASAAAPANDNRRRNRHSWTVGSAGVAVPHVGLASAHVSIDVAGADAC